MNKLIATTAIIVATATGASAFTCKNEYSYIPGLGSVLVGQACGTPGLNGDTSGLKVTPPEQVRNIAVAQLTSRTENTEEQKAQNALLGEYRATRRALEAYYNKYDLDTGLIDTEVQAGIDAFNNGDFELAYDLSVSFWHEYMVNPERNIWEYDDYKATEPLTQKLAELQAEGALD